MTVGVDLVAVSSADGIEKWHEIWSGWDALRVLLLELGQDVEAMSNENAGALLTAATATAWGHAIHAAIDAERIVVATYPDGNFHGGVRKDLLVKDTPSPVALEDRMDGYSFRILFGRAPSPGHPATQEPTSVVPLAHDSDFDACLRGFAAFCSGSGGFLQY